LISVLHNHIFPIDIKTPDHTYTSVALIELFFTDLLIYTNVPL